MYTYISIVKTSQTEGTNLKNIKEGWMEGVKKGKVRYKYYNYKLKDNKESFTEQFFIVYVTIDNNF